MTSGVDDDADDSSPEYISDSEIFPEHVGSAGKPPLSGGSSLFSYEPLNQEELEALRARQVSYLAAGSGDAAAAMAAHEVLAHSKWSFPDAVTALALPRGGDDGASQALCPICMESAEAQEAALLKPFVGCGHWMCAECFPPYVLDHVRSLLHNSGAGAAVPCPQCKAGPSSSQLCPGLVGEDLVRSVLESADEHSLFQRYREERKNVLPRYQAQCTSPTCQRVVRARTHPPPLTLALEITQPPSTAVARGPQHDTATAASPHTDAYVP